jgi:hypothetical protein
MKGIARSVFSEAPPKSFGVEIIGVLPGFTGPRQSTIIARLSGKNVDRTGVFAGMSGSPVFIDGRLVGAVAYSFPFAKEPICGITPIEQMIDIFESGTPRIARQPRAVSMAQLARADWKTVLPKQAVAGGPLIASVAAGSPLSALHRSDDSADRDAGSFQRHQSGNAFGFLRRTHEGRLITSVRRRWCVADYTA